MNLNTAAAIGFVAGAVVTATIAAVAGVGVLTTDADQNASDDALEEEHEPAKIEHITAREAMVSESRECVIDARVDLLNDDDRVVIEPAPYRDDMKQTTAMAAAFATTYADTGDEVRVYSLVFDGPTTVHYEGTVTDDCDLSEKGDESDGDSR